MDMDDPSACVDIAGFEIERFLESQATGIDGCQEDIVVEGVDPLEDAVDFFSGKYCRQSSFGLCLEDIEDVPVTPYDMEIEELDCAVSDSQGIGSPLVHVFSVEEICFEFLFGDLIGVLAMELDEHAHSPCV